MPVTQLQRFGRQVPLGNVRGKQKYCVKNDFPVSKLTSSRKRNTGKKISDKRKLKQKLAKVKKIKGPIQ